MISLKSEIVKKVLGYYFINPEARHYSRELANILKLDPGNLSRKLAEMAGEGLFKVESEGRNRYFLLNKDFPLLAEYQKIYQVKFGVAESLSAILRHVSGLKRACIFGSYAKGNFEAGSDIDLLLVGEFDYQAVSRSLAKLEKQWRREINIIDFTSQEFAVKRKKKDEFLVNILEGKKIELI